MVVLKDTASVFRGSTFASSGSRSSPSQPVVEASLAEAAPHRPTAPTRSRLAAPLPPSSHRHALQATPRAVSRQHDDWRGGPVGVSIQRRRSPCRWCYRAAPSRKTHPPSSRELAHRPQHGLAWNPDDATERLVQFHDQEHGDRYRHRCGDQGSTRSSRWKGRAD